MNDPYVTWHEEAIRMNTCWSSQPHRQYELPQEVKDAIQAERDRSE